MVSYSRATLWPRPVCVLGAGTTQSHAQPVRNRVVSVNKKTPVRASFIIKCDGVVNSMYDKTTALQLAETVGDTE